MCAGRRRHQDYGTMPLITIWRTLWCIPHSFEDLAKWILLANHVWRHKGLHPEVWRMSEAQEYQFKRCHATHQQPPDRAFWCLGYRLHGTFSKSKNCEYILVAVDYVSKWVQAMPCRSADAKNSKKMIEETIFPRFGVPRMVISDGGPHFTDKNFHNYL